MTTLELNLPDNLAAEARQAGLLSPSELEKMVREALRNRRVEKLEAARDILASDPMPPMTAEEIQAEIEAYRAEQRHAAGS